MKKKAKPKKRNPQDATLRNIRALKKQIADLRGRVKVLETIEERRWKAGFARLREEGQKLVFTDGTGTMEKGK